MARKPDDSLSQNIRDSFLQCKICLDVLKEPKTLPCLHTFCADCIDLYIERNRVDMRKFCCPICRRPTYVPKDGVDGFPDSFFVQSLSDIVDQKGNEKVCGICKFREGKVPSSSLCIDCKIELCECCAELHKNAKVTEGHTLLPIIVDSVNTKSKENYCRIHPGETIKYYCETCNAPICLPCTFLDHTGHQIEEFKDIRNSFAEDMNDLVRNSKDALVMWKQSKVELIEFENELFIRKGAVKADIRRSVQHLHMMLNEQEAHITNELDSFYDVGSLSRDRHQLERNIHRLEQAHDFADMLMSSDTSPITQLVNRAEAKDNLQQALRLHCPDINRHAGKLEDHVQFLPGLYSINLGSVLCNRGSSSNSITKLKQLMPSTKATFISNVDLRLDGPSFTDIIAIDFSKRGDIIILTNKIKRMKFFNLKGDFIADLCDETDIIQPTAMTVLREGTIAVIDSGDLMIKTFDLGGYLQTQFGGNDVFQSPVSIINDSCNKILVLDSSKQRVTIHKETGEMLKEFEISEVKMPQHICCHENKIYIADCTNNNIFIYNYTKTLDFIAKFTTPEDGPGEFLDCSGVTMDNHGNLLVADSLLNKIHMFTINGKITTILPVGKSFLTPKIISLSIGGHLIVAEMGVASLDDDCANNLTISIYKLVKVET